MQMHFSIIVAMDRNRVIGNENKLPWHIPSDLRRFREITTGHAVVMGRKTYESIIEKLGGPLKRRRNIVLTQQNNFVAEDCVVVHSIKELMELGIGHAFVIGGMEIYKLLLPHTKRLYLTLIDADVGGDARFPELNHSSWKLTSRETLKQDEGDQYPSSFGEYEKTF